MTELTRETFVWTTQTGQKLPLNRITDRHLGNIVSFLKRKMWQKMTEDYQSFSMLQGGMVMDAAQSQIDAEADTYEELIAFLETEMKLRGISNV